MNENKVTPRAEESLRLAQEAAQDLGHGYVGCEHLLLGLLREEEGIAHRVLSEYGLTDEMITGILQRSVGQGTSGDAPSQGLTPRAKSVIELAVGESHRMGAGYIGTEHLLMGLLREGSNMAVRILRGRCTPPCSRSSVRPVPILSPAVPALPTRRTKRPARRWRSLPGI